MRIGPLAAVGYAQALLVAWVVYDGAATERLPFGSGADIAGAGLGEHAGHGLPGTPQAAAELSGGPLFLALVVAAVYLLLPALTVASLALRRLLARFRAGELASALAFVAAGAIAGVLATTPIAWLAGRLTHGGQGSLFSAVVVDSATALRYSFLLGIVLVAVLGVPWSSGRSARARTARTAPTSVTEGTP
ncbi:hypothetical protein AB0K09_04640 [Streptomyces sp. NPDC049577]|uniref:hypothetical protein n=1 Tax=Streptomyces sp. NPDC049577 TaxID=3155153 RepID=UPI003430AAF6